MVFRIQSHSNNTGEFGYVLLADSYIKLHLSKLDTCLVFEKPPSYFTIRWGNAKVLSVKATIYNTPRDPKMSSLKNTMEKIKSLEAEKKNLLSELEELRKAADAKATQLDNEVGALREEIKSLRILMGQPEASPNKIQI
jgi:hypothetical protein